MPVVLGALRDERIAGVEVDGNVEFGDGGPEVLIAWVVEVDDRVLVIDLGEAVDERPEETEFLHRSSQLLRGSIRVLHGEGSEGGEAGGVHRDLVGGVVVEAVGPIDGVSPIVERLDSRREEGEDDLLDLEVVHLLQPGLVDVEQRCSPGRPRVGGEVLGGLLDDVRVGGAEVLFEGDLLHGVLCSLLVVVRVVGRRRLRAGKRRVRRRSGHRRSRRRWAARLGG